MCIRDSYEDNKELNSCGEVFSTMLKLWLYQFFIDPLPLSNLLFEDMEERG